MIQCLSPLSSPLYVEMTIPRHSSSPPQYELLHSRFIFICRTPIVAFFLQFQSSMHVSACGVYDWVPATFGLQELFSIISVVRKRSWEKSPPPLGTIWTSPLVSANLESFKSCKKWHGIIPIVLTHVRYIFCYTFCARIHLVDVLCITSFHLSIQGIVPIDPATRWFAAAPSTSFLITCDNSIYNSTALVEQFAKVLRRSGRTIALHTLPSSPRELNGNESVQFEVISSNSLECIAAESFSYGLPAPNIAVSDANNS